MSNINSFYQEKIFREPSKKKKAAEKDKSDKEDKPKDENLVLASKQVRVMPLQKNPKLVQGKKIEKLIKKTNGTYLETIAKEEVQAISAVAKVKKILAITEKAAENQIIYTPESAAASLDAAIITFPIPEAQLEFLTVPEKPNV